MSKIAYILVAGGPCSGKTTLVNALSNELSKRGLRVYVIRDWARELIRKNRGVGGPLPWTNRVEFEVKVVKEHLKDYRRALRQSLDVIVEDSGPISAIAYCRVDKVELPSEVLRKIIEHTRNIDIVILTHMNAGMYSKDSERWESKDYALRIHKEIINIHKELLHNKVYLVSHSMRPELRLKDVIDYVIKYLKRKGLITGNQ